MGGSEESGKTSASPNPKRRRHEPLKAVNARASSAGRAVPSSMPASTTPRAPPKPRQSLLPPKLSLPKPSLVNGQSSSGVTTVAVKGAESQKKAEGGATSHRKVENGVVVGNSGGVGKSGRQTPTVVVGTASGVIGDSRSKLARSTFPTSSFAQPSSFSSRPPVRRKTSIPSTKPLFDETQKLTSLRYNARACDALAIVLNYVLTTSEKKIEGLRRDTEKLSAELRTAVKEHEATLTSLEAKHARHIENVIRAHSEDLENVEKRHNTDLSECSEERERVLADLKASHESELEQLSRAHQIQCAHLDSKLAETEKAFEEAIREKKTLEATLSKDADEKVARLSKEISSLNAALDMKSAEMRELRHENAKLLIKVEEIPARDIEISKLKHHVRELKQILDRKTSTERALTGKVEELQRSARSHAEMSESMLKENDLLRFKIEEMESSTSEGEHTQPKKEISSEPRMSTSQGVALRSRSTHSERRPASSVNPSKIARSVHETARHSVDDEVLNRSVISLYQEQGRNRLSCTDVDTIYAPEGTFFGKLDFENEEHDADDEGSSSSVRRIERSSGGGTGGGAVTDSGISV